MFGIPRVDDVTVPGQALRAKAAELGVFLACHPEGVDTRTIGDHLERSVRLRSADVRVHTNVSNLRHVMGRAAGPRKIGYVIKPGGRYRLDPTTVDVDLWQLRDLTARAATAPVDERTRLLRQACELYTAPLATGCDYDWVEPHREKARQQAADALLLLADTLMDVDPQAASDILDRQGRRPPSLRFRNPDNHQRRLRLHCTRHARRITAGAKAEPQQHRTAHMTPARTTASPWWRRPALGGVNAARDLAVGDLARRSRVVSSWWHKRMHGPSGTSPERADRRYPGNCGGRLNRLVQSSTWSRDRRVASGLLDLAAATPASSTCIYGSSCRSTLAELTTGPASVRRLAFWTASTPTPLCARFSGTLSAGRSYPSNWPRWYPIGTELLVSRLGTDRCFASSRAPRYREAQGPRRSNSCSCGGQLVATATARACLCPATPARWSASPR